MDPSECPLPQMQTFWGRVIYEVVNVTLPMSFGSLRKQQVGAEVAMGARKRLDLLGTD